MAKGFFAKLQIGLAKTRDKFLWGMDNVFYDDAFVDEEFYEELEEILIMADIGINATSRIIDKLRAQVKEQGIIHRAKCKELLIQKGSQGPERGHTILGLGDPKQGYRHTETGIFWEQH